MKKQDLSAPTGFQVQVFQTLRVEVPANRGYSLAFQLTAQAIHVIDKGLILGHQALDLAHCV